MKERSHNLNVRVNDEELAMAHALADANDEPVTRLVRRSIKEQYVARFGVTPPKKSKK